MLKYSPVLILTLLAACAGDPIPTITSGTQLSKSRVVLVKGIVGGSSASEAYLEERTYPVTCQPDNQGGTPDQRASAMIAEAAKVLGQVDIPMGPGYRRSSDMRQINSYALSKYRCSVDGFTARVVGRGDNEAMQWAIRNGALAELASES